MNHELGRRGLLKAGLALAAVTGSSSLLSACSSGTGPSRAEGPALPTYQPMADAPKPDLPGNVDGVLDAFYHYPASPPSIYKGGTPGDGQAITAMAAFNTAIPPAVDKNPYWQEVNRRIGSPVEMLLTPSAEYDAKLATVTAGNDFPNLMQITNNAVPALDQFLEAKMLDLSPYLGGDKVKEYPALASIPAKHWEPCVFNGKLFAIPIPRGMNSTQVLYYRTDVLEAAGVDAKITRFSDLVERARAVTDPKAGRWAFASNPLLYVRQMLAIPNGWQKGNEGFVHSYEDERQQQALDSVRQLQQSGLINPDMAAAPSSQQHQWFGSKQAAFHVTSYSSWPGLVQGFSLPAEAIGATPVVGYDGGKGMGWIGPLNNSITVISRGSADRIKSILKFLDYLASPFGSEEYLFLTQGIKGRNFTLRGTDPVAVQDKSTEKSLMLAYVAAPVPVLFRPDVAGYAERAHESQSNYVKNAQSDLAEKLYSKTNSRKNAQLLSAMSNLELDIIYGRKPVSAWAEGVAKWRRDGGDQIRTELQAAQDAAR